MNEDLEAINESVSLGNAGDAVANLAPKDTGVASALGWTVRVGGLNLSRSGTNRAGAWWPQTPVFQMAHSIIR